MTWGYSPRPVVRGREASLDKGTSKGPGFLLVLVGLCACLFVFGIVSELMTSRSESKPEDSLQFNGGNQRKEGLIQEPEGNNREDEMYGKLRWEPKETKRRKPGTQRTTYEKDKIGREAGNPENGLKD